jgi:MFS family permease
MRNVIVLGVAQALSAAGMMTMTLLGGILGSELASSPQLATLPVSLLILGLALTTLPAALIMQRVGRRNAFIGSALMAALAALAVAWAIVQASFVLLCGAALFLGANPHSSSSIASAAESVPPDG